MAYIFEQLFKEDCQAYSCVRLERSSGETNDRTPRTLKKNPRFLRKKKEKMEKKKTNALTESYFSFALLLKI